VAKVLVVWSPGPPSLTFKLYHVHARALSWRQHYKVRSQLRTLAARGRRIKLLFTAPNFLKHFLDFWEKTLSNDNAMRQSVREPVFTRTLLRYVRVFAIANPSVVCRLSVCRLSVTLVNLLRGLKLSPIFLTAVYAGHPLTSVQTFTEIVEGGPLRRVR